MNIRDVQVLRSVSFRKDIILDRLAERFNVAQFVSFAPVGGDVLQQYSRVSGFAANFEFASVDEAVAVLLSRSGEHSVNVRSFSEEQSQSREFLYGLTSIDAVVAAVRRLAGEGFFSIVNETIDVSDGGVSGVAMGNVVEFRPDATPRGVENPGFAALPHAWARSILRSVYGFDPQIEAGIAGRLEFSVHPKPRGWRQDHVIHWEFGPSADLARAVLPAWPNSFSRMLGDKAYGLLVADAAGAAVPLTTVVGRRVAPFSFGTDTGSYERWIRTSPTVQVPGKFTTARGWMDPFALARKEDPEGDQLASVLSQQGVRASWSGAAIVDANGLVVVEGVAGTGEEFMQGTVPPQTLPSDVMEAVRMTHAALGGSLGPVRLEWVHDGERVWILQLHSGSSSSAGSVVVPGEATSWVSFRVSQGLEALRELVGTIAQGGGILLDGQVGLTSHIADVIRKAGVPARIYVGDDIETPPKT